jgi:hypothetical protein
MEWESTVDGGAITSLRYRGTTARYATGNDVAITLQAPDYMLSAKMGRAARRWQQQRLIRSREPHMESA